MTIMADSASQKWNALTAIAAYIHSNGSRGAPIDELTPEIQSILPELVDAGALVRDSGTIGFFHDTLYDYVLARMWAESEIDLVAFVLETGQDLSDRSITRQVLLYQQGTNRTDYAQSLSALIFHDDIRLHIKDVALAVMRSDPNPDDLAWNVVQQLRESISTWRDCLVDIFSQPAWFHFADSKGAILLWTLNSDDPMNSAMASVLINGQRSNPDRVATILAGLLPVRASWDAITRVLLSANVDDSSKYFAVIADAITLGVFDNGTRFASDMFLYPLNRPQSAGTEAEFRVVRALMERWYLLASRTGRELRDVLSRDHLISEYLTSCANSFPLRFLEAALEPTCNFLVEIAESEQRVYGDDPWSHLYINSLHDADDVVFWMLASSLRAVATKSPTRLRRFETYLRRVASTNSGKFWLYSAWSSNPQAFARRALDHLASDPETTLRCGYADSPYWMARELVGAIHPHLSPADRRRLEEILMGFFPEWERSSLGRRSHGDAQYTLLDALTTRNMSASARKRYLELGRKFRQPPAPPNAIEANFVPPPIPAERTKLMNDAQWLQAFRRYSTDERVDWTKGGAHELARTLEAATRDDPTRFAKLALRLPNDINESYPSAILMGLADTVTDGEAGVVYDAIRRIFELPGHPCGRWIGRPLARLADCAIPDDVLDIVIWYATSDSDPSSEVWKPTSKGREGYYGGNPLMAGLNSVRGAMAEAISALIWPSRNRIDPLRQAIEALCEDRISSVRCMAATTVLSLAEHDFATAKTLFRKLIVHEEVRYLASWPVERAAMYFAQRRNSGLHPMIRRMLAADDPDLQRSAGRQAMLILLRHHQGALAREAALASAHARAGMAQVAAANLFYRPWAAQCEEQLRDFLDDTHEEVREAARGWIRGEAALDQASYEFLTQFMNSSAYLDDPSQFLEALDSSNRVSADIMLQAVESVVDKRLQELSDLRTGLSADVHVISKLLMRAYGSSPDTGTKHRALDLIDRMMLVSGSEVRQLVQGYA